MMKGNVHNSMGTGSGTAGGTAAADDTASSSSRSSETSEYGGRCRNYSGVVGTIFEEEENYDDDYDNDGADEEEEIEILRQRSSYSSIIPPSPYSSPPFSNTCTPDLQSILHAWTLASKNKPDVKIYVQGECFHLHKDVLTSKSAYLRRHLTEAAELTLSPKFKVTPETFELIAQHCYSCDVLITPFNIAALRTASEVLGLNSSDAQHCLRQKTESYFSHLLVVGNKEFLPLVLGSSFGLFPEVEEMVFIPSRCVEALWGLEGGGEGIRLLGDGIKGMKPEDLGLVLEGMKTRITRRSHDLLYRVVDLYFEVYTGMISEEQKSQICNSIDCSLLSSQLLLHAVQNPKMPLRFILQAMLMEQVNTHRSIFSAITTTKNLPPPPPPPPQPQPQPQEGTPQVETLGAILQKETALRQVAKIKSTIDNTSSRIQSLEKELSDLRKLLQESERRSNVLALDQGRSSISCRFTSKDKKKDDHGHSECGDSKVGRGERGSKSSSYLRFGTKEKRSTSLENDQTPRMRKTLGKRLMIGLKSAFRVSGTSSRSNKAKLVEGLKENKEDHEDCKCNVGDDLIGGTVPWVENGGLVKERFPPHRRIRSLGI